MATNHAGNQLLGHCFILCYVLAENSQIGQVVSIIQLVCSGLDQDADLITPCLIGQSNITDCQILLPLCHQHCNLTKR